MRAKRIAILGLGLIGSSLARGLAQNCPNIHIASYDTIPASLNYALAEGFIHSAFATPQAAVADAEIIVLATPLRAFAELTQTIRPALAEGAVFIDTGSVKRQAIAAIAPHIPEHCRYVPCHPIAGSEQSGVEAGHGDLFTGRQVILTPDKSALRDPSVMTAKNFWEQFGAQIEFMPPELHDHIYAYVSHLPQLLAFAARGPLQSLHAVGGDTADLPAARLAASDPQLWSEIFVANADYIQQGLSDYRAFAAQIVHELAQEPQNSDNVASGQAPLLAALIATCLIATASQLQESLGVHPARYAGRGFADMIASAGSKPETTLAAISKHHTELAPAMQALLANLALIQSALERRDADVLLKILQV